MQGEAYINRAAILLTQTKNDGLQIIYKVCQGRVLDYKRKFIEVTLFVIFSFCLLSIVLLHLLLSPLTPRRRRVGTTS